MFWTYAGLASQAAVEAKLCYVMLPWMSTSIGQGGYNLMLSPAGHGRSSVATHGSTAGRTGAAGTFVSSRASQNQWILFSELPSRCFKDLCVGDLEENYRLVGGVNRLYFSRSMFLF